MIALLGASGYFGQVFEGFFRSQGIPCQSVSRRDLDYYDPDRLTDWLTTESPRFLVNAAGYTGKPNVDKCESEKIECMRGNVMLPAMIRIACERAEIPWGHVSSGCIYTGTREDGSGFRETDPPNFSFRQNNCSFYSGCKALGEELLEGARQCYIWRPRLPFNHIDSNRNYLSKLLTYERLVDVRNSISHLDEFVAACYQCLDDGLDYGIYNLTNAGSITTRQVTAMMRDAGLTSKEFHFFESEQHFMRQAAIAPRSNCVLDNSKAIRAGLQLSTAEEALEKAFRQWSTRG